MIKKTLKIKNEHGLHMRPAMLVCDTAEEFKSDITIVKNEEQANAKSIMEVTMLAVLQGEEITIQAEGEDEQEAIDALKELITSDFEMIET